MSGERFNQLACDVAAAARRVHKGAIGLPLVDLEREVMEAVMGFDAAAVAAGSSSSEEASDDSGTSDSDDASEDGSSSDDNSGDSDASDGGDDGDAAEAAAASAGSGGGDGRAASATAAVPAPAPAAPAVELLTGEPTAQGGALRQLSEITAPAATMAPGQVAHGAHHPGIVVVEENADVDITE